jgi:protein-arginine kinase activator protein McsA
LFEEMGMLDPTSPTLLRGSLWEYSLAELDMMLVEMLAKEDYERAAKVRDIIQQKKARAQE